VWGTSPRIKFKIHILRTNEINHRNLENILTKTYEDGIMECLEVLEKYKLVGIYDVPIRYIEEAIRKLLTTPEK
jgi:hypothetical protein